MNTRIEKNDIIISTNLGGIALYQAHENDIKTYQTMIDSNIKKYRELTIKAEECKKEGQRQDIYTLRKLYDKHTYYIYSLLEIGEVLKQLYFAGSDIMKIYYISQLNLTLYKIIEKYEADEKEVKYENLFIQNNIPIEILTALNTFIIQNIPQIKKVRDLIAAHLDQNKSFTKLNDTLFSEYDADKTALLVCNFLSIWKLFLNTFHQAQIIYNQKHIQF